MLRAKSVGVNRQSGPQRKPLILQFKQSFRNLDCSTFLQVDAYTLGGYVLRRMR
ncbi:protein of unknown function [Shinella sp. WSC3-e]|nr:hypothetical protein SHINE37_42423 [Rhizobiaceae bacterium]CAK7257009.1 protein of unknown function [Shinella sp. WSC3-e]